MHCYQCEEEESSRWWEQLQQNYENQSMWADMWDSRQTTVCRSSVVFCWMTQGFSRQSPAGISERNRPNAVLLWTNISVLSVITPLVLWSTLCWPALCSPASNAIVSDALYSILGFRYDTTSHVLWISAQIKNLGGKARCMESIHHAFFDVQNRMYRQVSFTIYNEIKKNIKNEKFSVKIK